MEEETEEEEEERLTCNVVAVLRGNQSGCFCIVAELTTIKNEAFTGLNHKKL